MELFVVSIAALLASALTLYSGFGLGTLLMPVVAIFFPIDIAISITALVHLANNLFKVALLGAHANLKVLLQFGIPAVVFSFFGAITLGWLSGIPPLMEYVAFNKQIQIFPIKLIVGFLILGFVMLELSPKFAKINLDRKYLPYGGMVSGFFGGLSGHQGAFRSMFLLKAGLNKEQFIATGIMVAVLVDMARISIYGWEISARSQDIEWRLVIAASLSAFIGAYLSASLLKKFTIKAVQIAVSILLIVVSLGLISGFL